MKIMVVFGLIVGFGIGFLVGSGQPAPLEPLPLRDPSSTAKDPTDRSPVVSPPADQRPDGPAAERQSDAPPPRNLDELRAELDERERYIARLENQLAASDKLFSATQIARLAGTDVDELEMMLDDRRLISSLEMLAKTARATDVQRTWSALELERDYLEKLERLELSGPSIGGVASAADRARSRDYRVRVIRPWIDRNLPPLCASLRRLGIPEITVEHFESRCRRDRGQDDTNDDGR